MTWMRAYQCCGKAGCHNWIWEDRIQANYTCRLCGTPWKKPQQGYAQARDGRSSSWSKPRPRRVSPPPGLSTQRPPRSPKLQKTASEILAPAWNSLDEALRTKLTQVGINPTQKVVEPDLTDVLKENLASLPAPVKELVEKITKPQPETEKDMATRLKQQVTTLRDISQKKQLLQQKIDNTKKHYQELLDEMKSLQSKLEQEQASLNTISTAYLTKVSSSQAEMPLQPLETGMDDSVPAAVAGFINTLGVSLTQEQKDQLHVMLKRPSVAAEVTDEEAKRRKTELGNTASCG